MRSTSSHRIMGAGAGIKRSQIVKTAPKRLVLAILMALALGAMPPALNRVRANICGDLSLFAFPMQPMQGDSITVFVTVVNSANTDASFVVDTELSDPRSNGVGVDDRVVQIPAHSGISFQITLSTSSSSRTGTYTVDVRSHQSDALPICNNCTCITAQMQFELGCNSNNC